MTSPARPATSQTPTWPLIGNQLLGKRLVDALQSNRLPAVVFFSGPAGLGKRTAAQWLAAVDLCQADGQQPCNDCQSCRSLGPHHPRMNVLERSDGPHINVEDIRQLLGSVRMRLGADERHWVIIENVERLNENAANALLKFLEEPIAGLQIVMTSAEPDRVPSTIRSRAAVYRWHPVSRDAFQSVVGADQALMARAAGRPGIYHALTNQPDTQADEQQVIQQALDAITSQDPKRWQQALDAIPEETSTEHFQLWELALRELLLAKVGISSRRLWPGLSQAISQASERISKRQVFSQLERWQRRSDYLRQHVSPRFVLADLLIQA